MLLESGDCTHARFHPEFGREFQFMLKPSVLNNQNGYLAKEREFHFVNRWLRCLDAEMWDISVDFQAKDFTKSLPASVLSRIITTTTSLDEMKTRRLVSKRWNQVIISSEHWTDFTVAVIDSKNKKWSLSVPAAPCSSSFGGIGTDCASYLSNSVTRFFTWKTMRLKHLTSRHIYCFITFYSSLFRRSVRGIERLEIISCSFYWPDLLELLDLFTNVKDLILDKCSFEFEEPLVDNMLYHMGFKVPLGFQDVVEEVDFLCPQKDYFFGSLKSLELIEEDTHSNPITPTLLTLLKSRCGQLDNFILILGRGTSFIKTNSNQANYWRSVHSFLVEKNVISCHIISRHSVAIGMTNRFLSCMAEWRLPCKDSGIPHYRINNRMKELSIDLRPFTLWFGLQKQLIPMLHRLSHLKLFSLKNIVLRGHGTSCIREIHDFQAATNPACKLRFGVILDDHGGVTGSAIERENLTSKMFRDHLIAVEIIVQTDFIREIRDMIPYLKNLKFPHVEQFTFTTNSTHRPRFFTFNMNAIVHNFPALVELKILDGPAFAYNSFFSQKDGQWNEMSGAMFGDADLQLVLRSLPLLRVLMLRVNMKYITDAGFTGVSSAYCTRLVQRWKAIKAIQVPQDVDLMYQEGVDFSVLKNLEYLSIDGVGPGITDVTPLLAFQNVTKSLKYLGLFGSHKISANGKKRLEDSIKSCTVEIN